MQPIALKTPRADGSLLLSGRFSQLFSHSSTLFHVTTSSTHHTSFIFVYTTVRFNKLFTQLSVLLDYELLYGREHVFIYVYSTE